MEGNKKNPLAPALDWFERYYTEKIWEWIPAVYKEEDGIPGRTDVLRSLVRVMARQAAIARRSIDRLWEDEFIELCDDWAIPYIGELVGTRLVHELNRRGRRVDVARTIFYRRRKGTLPVLETLIRDIGEWEGVVVESFRRLARTRHGLDPEPAGLEGFVTRTPPGGWARLVSTRGAELVGGPFDEMAHTPDFRQLRGELGRYNIPKLNFHLFRLLPFEVNFATPAKFGGGRFTFDPSGRDIPLFRPDQRSGPQKCGSPRAGELSASQCGSALEWQLPAPIPCRLLGAARYIISAALLDKLADLGLSQPATNELSRYVGVLFESEARLRQTVASLSEAADILAQFDPLLAGAITPDSPKARLIPSEIQHDPSAVAIADANPLNNPAIAHQQIAAGNLEDWGASLGMLPPGKILVIDPERGRFLYRKPPVRKVWVPLYHYGFSGNIGAGTYDRRGHILADDLLSIVNGGGTNPGPMPMSLPPPPLSGVIQFKNSKTYLPNADITGIEKLTLQADNFMRPYVKRKVTGGTEWVFAAEPKPAQPDPDAEKDRRDLTLEGLWIGIEEKGAVASSVPCSPVPASLVLVGVFDRVVIRHCTLDPGGEKARVDPDECQSIPYVQIVVRGTVEELVIDTSIVGPIVEDKVTGDPGAIQKLVISDSIVHSIDVNNNIPAIATELGLVEMERVTVFGDVKANRLAASEALIQGVVKVTDNQRGCFRFSATSDHPEKRLPPQFESHLFKPAVPNHFFVSRRLGDPGYAQLSDTAPVEVVRGAENRGEMGAFSGLINPIKLDDLKAKVNEFMPFGLIAQFINET